MNDVYFKKNNSIYSKIILRSLFGTFSSMKAADDYFCRWKAQNQNSGIYFFELAGQSFAQVRRMILLQ